MASTYPFEPTPPWTTVNPRPFLPFRTRHRSKGLGAPPLPSPRNELFDDNHVVSTHLVPAGCPRLTPDIPLPVVPEFSTNASERKYGKRLRYLLSSPTASLIDEVWSWEAIQHGDAAIVNETNLSGIFDWRDNARDIAHFLLYYLPEDASSKALPTHLHLLPGNISESRKTNEFSSRSLAVGHSFGCCSPILAAVNFSALFSFMILMDPVVIKHRNNFSNFQSIKSTSALTRRGRWPSREEALRLFRASPFFGIWQLYVTYALCEDSQGGVKLKMSGLHEALIFADRIGSNEAWELEKVDELIELRWIVPGKPEDKGCVVPSDKHKFSSTIVRLELWATKRRMESWTPALRYTM
ncbi:alpha beta-hydrolase [Suillus lakei]|nr:alpha beta-hydrolase [Suillus lakei]